MKKHNIGFDLVVKGKWGLERRDLVILAALIAGSVTVRCDVRVPSRYPTIPKDSQIFSTACAGKTCDALPVGAQK